MELRHSELGKKYMEWMLSDQPSELKHYGVRGQKWGVRRYQDQTGRNTELGLKRRRSGYDENEPKTLEELKKRDIEKGYVDKDGKGITTKESHKFEKKRRGNMSTEEQTSELKRLTKYWKNEQEKVSDKEMYESMKLKTEITNFIIDQHNAMAYTEKTKSVYDKYRKAMADYLIKNGPYSIYDEEAESVREPYRQKIDSAVLNELGYADTPEARECIRSVWDS